MHLDKLRYIQTEHRRWTHRLTALLLGLVFSLGAVLWSFDIVLVPMYKMVTGTVLMLVAIIFYKIPYLVFIVNRRRFMKRKDFIATMGNSWNAYKARILV